MRLLFCIIITLFFGQVLPMTLHSQTLYAAVTLPGTAMHEAAHWLMAKWLGGNPSAYSLIPTYSAGEMQTMGHVLFQPNSLNAASVGLAPYLIFFPACFLVTVAATCGIRWMIFWCYFAACCFASLTPSPQDWSIATSYPGSFIVMVLLFTTWIIVWVSLIKMRVGKRATS